MNEQDCNYVLKCLRATDVCLIGVDNALTALNKQMKINKKQKVINVILGVITLTCVSRIGQLVLAVNSHAETIKELINKSKETEEKKGE